MEGLCFLPPSELDAHIDRENTDIEKLTHSDFAFLAYYAKYVRKEIQSAVVRRIKATDLRSILDSYPTEVRRKIFENLGALQLTYGCNVGCDFCGFDAIPGAKAHIPFATIEWMIDHYGESIRRNDAFFYYASEGPDYQSGHDDGNIRDYSDVLDLCQRRLDWHPITRTTGKNRHHPILRKMTRKEQSFIISVTDEKERGDIPEDIWDSNLHLRQEDNIHVGTLGKKAIETGGIATEGIGCFDGALITPAGVYSVVQCSQIEDWRLAPQLQLVIPFSGQAEDNRDHTDVRTILNNEIPAFNPAYQGISYDQKLLRDHGVYTFGITPTQGETQIVSARNTTVDHVYRPNEIKPLSKLYEMLDRISFPRHDRTEVRWFPPVVAMTRAALLQSLSTTLSHDHLPSEVSDVIQKYITDANMSEEEADGTLEEMTLNFEWAREYLRLWKIHGEKPIDWIPMRFKADRTSELQTHESS